MVICKKIFLPFSNVLEAYTRLRKGIELVYQLLNVPNPAVLDIPIGISMMRKEVENDESVKLVGDDLLMSNAKRIERVVLEYACNALFLKRDPKSCESRNPICSKPTPAFK
ncbi:hypothetical protein S83_062852, partial [Arachis hypogaea]